MIAASDSPKGLGQVYEGNQYIADVAYRFNVRKDAGESISGYIQIVGGVMDQFGYGNGFTLRLDDSRQIDIVIKTWNFNSEEYLFVAKNAEE